jgi:SAM-dependent methyltransferase
VCASRAAPIAARADKEAAQVHQRLHSPEGVRSQYRESGNLDARVALHQRFSTNPYGWFRWVFDQLSLPRGGTVLELGCGPAYLWQANGGRTPAGWAIVLSDASPGMLRAAQRGLGTARSRFHYAVVDAQAIPFPDACFDAVIANHMLYHVPDKGRALAEIRRVLVRGGCLYASTVGQEHMRELDEMLNARPPSAGAAASFLLENGKAQLAPWFPSVQLVRYEDDLLVDAPEPLVAYARSMPGVPAHPEALHRFSQLVAREIATHGAIRITKDSGLFICSASGTRGIAPYEPFPSDTHARSAHIGEAAGRD